MRQHTRSRDGEQVLVVGSDPAAAVLARRLSDDVVFFGVEDGIARRVAKDVHDSGIVTDPGQISPPEDATAAVVATPDDGVNLLVTQRLRLESDVDVVVRLNDPTRRQAFDDLGAEVVCTSTEVGEALAEQYTNRVRSTE